MNTEKRRVEEENILDSIYSQISSFDNKASILVSIVGIVFALILNFLDVFSGESFNTIETNVKITYYFLFILFCLVALLTIFSFIMVIFPRKHKDAIHAPNYYRNIAQTDEEQYKQDLDKYLDTDDIIIKQIKINADICNKKHFWLKVGIILLIPFALIMFSLILLNIFCF